MSIGFGLGMMLVAYLVDYGQSLGPSSSARAEREGFGFWRYLFGVVAFWGALTSMESDSELSKAC